MKKHNKNVEALLQSLELIDGDLIWEAAQTDSAEKLTALKSKKTTPKKLKNRSYSFARFGAVAASAASFLLIIGIVLAAMRWGAIGSLPEESSQTSDQIVINPPAIPPKETGSVVIDSIDKLNYYGAMHVMGAKVNEPLSIPAADGQTVALSSSGGMYYYRLSRDTVYTISEVIYFQIELVDEFGFLASKLGLGSVDVVITKNNLDEMEYMITFKNGDRYYSCLLNSYSESDHMMTFSTHKYIDGLYLVKDMRQANYSFHFQFNPETYRILHFTCDYYRTTSDTYYSLRADPILEYSSTFRHVENVNRSFTLEELSHFYDREEELPKDFEEGNLEFTSNRDGTCYVSGTGDCTATTIIVPERSPDGDIVTAIGSNAFYASTLCESVVLPSTVKVIRSSAFWGCTYLKSIMLPDGLTTIEEYAFRECEYLRSIEIPDSVTRVGMGAFNSCLRLKSVKLPANLTTLEAGTFFECYKLEQVVMPMNLKVIEHNAFASCWLLPSIEISEGVVQIGQNAFQDCMSLSSLHIPSTAETIYFPIFSGCDELKQLTVSKDNSFYYSQDNCLIGKSTQELYAVCHDYVIPSDGSVKRIASDAFACLRYSNAFYDIVIPEGVERLMSYLFNDNQLRSVTIPSSVYYMNAYTFYMPANTNLKTVYYNGTTERWNQIASPSYWALGTGIIVHCTDGDIEYPKES